MVKIRITNNEQEIATNNEYVDSTGTKWIQGPQGIQGLKGDTGEIDLTNISNGSIIKKNGTVIDDAIAATDYVSPSVATTFTKQQTVQEAALTDGVNISWDLDLAQSASIVLEGNRTLDNPTNMVAGGNYILRIVQDSIGARTLSYGAVYKWPNGTPPTLTDTAGAIDIIAFVSDGTYMYGVAAQNFS